MAKNEQLAQKSDERTPSPERKEMKRGKRRRRGRRGNGKEKERIRVRRVKGERRVNEAWRKRRVEKVRIRYYFYFHNLINFKSFLLISILFCLEFIDSKKRGEG